MTVTARDAAIQEQRRTRAFAAHRIAGRRRKTLIEAVVGTIKTTLGGGQTSVRGRAKVEAEWLGLATGMNLRTLARIWRAMGDADRVAMLPTGGAGRDRRLRGEAGAGRSPSRGPFRGGTR